MNETSVQQPEETYVVTFEKGDTLSLSGLRQMSITDAQAVLKMASRIPKHGRIVKIA